MANVQCDNGYVVIATELFDALLQVSLSNYEHRVFLFIMRKTYGFKKKEDWISQSQIAGGLEIHKCNISRTIKRLLEKNMIFRKSRVIGVQKDYEKWKLSKQITFRLKQVAEKYKKLSKQITEVIQTDNKKLSKQIHTINTTNKKLIQKEKFAEFVTMTKEEYQKLVEKYGEEKTKLMIEKLDNYKGSTGKKYTSDYRTILSWVVDEILKKGKGKNESTFRA